MKCRIVQFIIYCFGCESINKCERVRKQLTQHRQNNTEWKKKDVEQQMRQREREKKRKVTEIAQ